MFFLYSLPYFVYLYQEEPQKALFLPALRLLFLSYIATDDAPSNIETPNA